MMPTVRRYATRLLLVHLALILVGFVALLQLLDLLNNGDEIVAEHGGRSSALWTYALLRLPSIVSVILPFSILMAALVTLARLARNNEILALKASGVSFYRLLFGLVPVALLVGCLHFLLNDQVLPPASQKLERWGAADAASTDRTVRSGQGGVWVRDGSTFIRVSSVLGEGSALLGVTLFRRNENGVLSEQIVARHAAYVDGSWRLADVSLIRLANDSNSSMIQVAEMPWETSLTPSHFADLATDPATLSFVDLWRFIVNPEVGSQPYSFYQTWFQRKFAVPLTAVLMILLAAPVAQGLQRHGGFAAGLAVGVGLGFLYFVTEGLMLTLGETGAVAPIIAAWGPAIVFAMFGTVALLRIEGY
ncbi:MAG: LPS export ABC transporter permease LptG [Dongiaceae bacterium]